MRNGRNPWPWLLCLFASTATAAPLRHIGSLNGPAESPPNASPATGFALVTVDTAAHTMAVDLSFSGLLGTTTASHIHCCTSTAGAGTAGVATVLPRFTGFPLGVTSGAYLHTFDMTNAASYNPSYVAGNGATTASAEAALAAGIAAGKAYFNIHTSVFPGGEIRAFLVADTIFIDGFE
jgi:hypothetical protein